MALGGANRELFSQIFAITVDELQDFEALASESSVSEALFAAGMQGAQRLPGALSALITQAAAVWGERAQKRPLNLALHALAETRTRLDATTQRPEAYFEAVAERGVLELELTQARAQLDALRLIAAPREAEPSPRPAAGAGEPGGRGRGRRRRQPRGAPALREPRGSPLGARCAPQLSLVTGRRTRGHPEGPRGILELPREPGRDPGRSLGLAGRGVVGSGARGP